MKAFVTETENGIWSERMEKRGKRRDDAIDRQSGTMHHLHKAIASVAFCPTQIKPSQKNPTFPTLLRQ